ncbi:MAG: hypothetical protein C5B47_03580 [Verrucomicrobia bacterium]|nr:MAG: hypothetical protein C5B47_03580 [Verrucomicrobiota bacterium]
MKHLNFGDEKIDERHFITHILMTHAMASCSERPQGAEERDRFLARVESLQKQTKSRELIIRASNMGMEECRQLCKELEEQFLKELRDILNTNLPKEFSNTIWEFPADIMELRTQFLKLIREAVVYENRSFRQKQNELLWWIQHPFSPCGEDCFDNKYYLKRDIQSYRQHLDKAQIEDIDKISAQQILQSRKEKMEELYSEFIFDPSIRDTFNKKLAVLIDDFFDKGYQSKLKHTLTNFVVNCGCGDNDSSTSDKLRLLLQELHDQNEESHKKLNYAKHLLELEKIFNSVPPDESIEFIIWNSPKKVDS